MAAILRRYLFAVVLLINQQTEAQFAEYRSAAELIRALQQHPSDTTKLRMLDELAYYYIAKPGEHQIDLDSALAVLDGSRQLRTTVDQPVWWGRYYLLRSKALREYRLEHPGRASLDTAIRLFRDAGLQELQGDAVRDLNQYYPSRTNAQVQEKVEILKRMIALYESAGARLKFAEGMTMLGDLYSFLDQDEQGVVVLEKALTAYKALRYPKLQVVYDLLGSCYGGVGDRQKAIQYGLLAVETAFQVGDTGMIVTFYNRLGLSFFQAGMLEEAGQYFRKSINSARAVGDSSDMILVGSHLADVYLAQHQPGLALDELLLIERHFNQGSLRQQSSLFGAMATALVDLGRYPEAWTYLQRMVKLDREVGYNTHQYRLLVHYYLATGDYVNVSAYADSLEHRNQLRGTSSDAPLVHLWRFKVDSAAGHLSSAIREYQRYKQLTDIAFSEQNKRELARLNVIYESDRKDRDLQANQLSILTLQKADRIKTSAIERERMNRNLIITGTAVLLLLLLLLYNRYRLKQRSNQQLIRQQTEIQGQNIRLQQLLREKEWLVKEIHHRVKNNLQLVMSLLNTQADYSANEHSLAAIDDSRQRMFAMSLIHQKLYQAEQLTLVNMSVYIPELVEFLRDSFAAGDQVRFELAIESIELDVGQAMSVGLILNELVTNSFKYAFTQGKTGLLRISCSIDEKGCFSMDLTDNGTGLPASVDPSHSDTMGLQLISTLTEQLGGRVRFINESGLRVILVFSPHSTIYTSDYERNIADR